MVVVGESYHSAYQLTLSIEHLFAFGLTGVTPSSPSTLEDTPTKDSEDR